MPCKKTALRGSEKFIELLTDQEFDAESGLYNYDARMYDPVIGRFISPDSMIPQPFNPQSLNRYSYCLNNPLIYTDPTGHFYDLDEYTLPTIYVWSTTLREWMEKLARANNYSWNLMMLLAGPAIANAAPPTTGAAKNNEPSPYDYLAEGEVGINFHGNKRNREISKAYKDKEGRFTIYGEGNQKAIDDWTAGEVNPDRLSPTDLAKFMVEKRGYDGGDILLIACNTGKGGKDSFAYNLREILITRYNIDPMTITAPNNLIRIRGNYKKPDSLYLDIANGGTLVDFPPGG